MNMPLLLGLSGIFGCLLQYTSEPRLQALGRLMQNTRDPKMDDVLQDLMKVFGYKGQNTDYKKNTKKTEQNPFEQKTDIILNVDGKFSNLYNEVEKYFKQNDSHKDYDNINEYLTKCLKLSLPQAYHILQNIFQTPYAQALIQGAQEMQKYYSSKPVFNRSAACINIIKDTCSLVVNNGLHFISSDNAYSNFIAPIQNVIKNTLVQNSPDNISIYSTSALGQIGSESPIQTNVEICGSGLGIKIMPYILSLQEQISKDYNLSPMLGDNIVKNIELFENSLSTYIPEIASYKKEFQEFLVGALIGDKYNAATKRVLEGFLEYWMKGSTASKNVASTNIIPINLSKTTNTEIKK